MSTKSDVFLLIDFLVTHLFVEFLLATMMPGLHWSDIALSSRALHLISVRLVWSYGEMMQRPISKITGAISAKLYHEENWGKEETAKFLERRGTLSYPSCGDIFFLSFFARFFLSLPAMSHDEDWRARKMGRWCGIRRIEFHDEQVSRKPKKRITKGIFNC